MMQRRASGLTRFLPFLEWAPDYNRDTLSKDLVAAVVVTIMLIPQSLAYATLAGLPPEVGLYASIAPLILYAMFGSSRVLAVGPVAVVSLMTATAIGEHAVIGSAYQGAVAITLAFLSGAMLMIMGLLRLGFMASFLSHPVISGFITASALLIAVGQLKEMLGINVDGRTFVELLLGLVRQWDQIHLLTALLGLAVLLFLFWARVGLKPRLMSLGLPARVAEAVVKAAPVAAIASTAMLVWRLELHSAGLKIVGAVPAGLPPWTWPEWDIALWKELAVPALLIGVVGFVESVSVGQALAAKRRQRIEPDRELVALGASNVGAAFTGGFPVTGGFSRSVVNFEAGAQTPAAGVFVAAGILLAAAFLTPALYFVPKAALSATIVVAVMSLVDLGVFRSTWKYSRADFSASLATLCTTLLVGVEEGLIAGVSISLLLYLFKTSRPHIAEVGLVPGTEHFRNVLRHKVRVSPQLASLRVDESLYFANVRILEDRINAMVAERPELKHLILQCSAINDIDASALESLQSINQRLIDSGVRFHMSEIKGPLMDRLEGTDFLRQLSGSVYLSHFQALASLAPEMVQ